MTTLHRAVRETYTTTTSINLEYTTHGSDVDTRKNVLSPSDIFPLVREIVQRRVGVQESSWIPITALRRSENGADGGEMRGLNPGGGCDFGNVHNRARRPLDERVVALTGEESGYLLHVRRPVDLSV